MSIDFPYAIQPDDEVVRLYEVAARIGARTTDGEWFSFSSVLLALLHAELPIASWFAGFVGGHGVRVDAILRDRGLTRDAVREAVAAREPVGGVRTFTPSAREVFLSSVLLAEKVGASRIGARHVMGAYSAFHYPNHEAQLQAWGFVTRRWFTSLVDYLEPRVAADELRRWTTVAEELAPYGRDRGALRRELSALYDTRAEIERVLSDAAIEAQRIDLTGSAENVWQRVIEAASRWGALGVLIEVARREYPNNALLESLR